jgi:hypothetical protein
MGNVIRMPGQPGGGFDDQPGIGMAAMRMTTGLQPDEFSEALGSELGWPVPLLVYLQWEQATAPAPPPGVVQAARRVCTSQRIGLPNTGRTSRRDFLGGVVGLSALALTGLGSGAASTAGLIEVGGSGRKWRASSGTAADLAELAHAYRRAYAGRANVDQLLPSAMNLMHLLMDMARRDQWPGSHAALASLIGQMALLTGLLRLMGPRDLEGARTHYSLALDAATEAEDWDLASYVLGSLAFEASSAHRTGDADAYRDAACDLARRESTPRTHAWVAALSSELFAQEGEEASSLRLLDEGFDAIAHTRSDPTWHGIGWFDETRLIAYEGGNLVLMGRHSAAIGALRSALGQLEPDRLKHRSTLSSDLALALANQGEVEESCALASEALDLATQIAHRESIDRVRRVHFRLLRWRTTPAVRDLTDRLQAQ